MTTNTTNKTNTDNRPWIIRVKEYLLKTGLSYKTKDKPEVMVHLVPVIENKVFKKVECPHCHSSNAFLFEGMTPHRAFAAVACLPCNKARLVNSADYVAKPEAVKDENSARPIAEDKRCKANTKAGKRCKNDALPGKCYCKVHNKEK